MRYFTWKLDWSSEEGTDPSSVINTETIRLEPAFSTGLITDRDSTIYGYWLKGEPDLTVLTPWQFTETTVEAMFAAAKLLVPEAVLIDEVIKFPEMPRL